MQHSIIYIKHGTRMRMTNPDIKLGNRVSVDFHEATVNGESGLLTTTKIIAHQRVRFFVPNTNNQKA